MAAKLLHVWKRHAIRLKREAYAVYLAYRDPRVPWYAKILLVCIIGYAFSPIDKLLNSIPIIGYLDHLILVPLGVVLVFKQMIPPEVMTRCRKIALNRRTPSNWVDGFIIAFILLLLVSVGIASTLWTMKDWNLVLGQWIRRFARVPPISRLNVR